MLQVRHALQKSVIRIRVESVLSIVGILVRSGRPKLQDAYQNAHITTVRGLLLGKYRNFAARLRKQLITVWLLYMIVLPRSLKGPETSD